MALRTGGLDGKKALLHLDASAAVARRTGDSLGSRRCTGAFARGAFLHAVDDDVFGRPLDGFFKRDFKVVTEMVAAFRTAGTASATAKKAPESKHVVEMAEDVAHIGPAVARAPEAIFAVLIVNLAFLRVAQNFISFGAFLELRFGLWVSLVVVRMPLHGEFPVGFLDFFFVRFARDAEYVVIIFGHVLTLSWWRLNGNDGAPPKTAPRKTAR